MRALGKFLVWIAVGLAGTGSLLVIALHRGESINAMWLVTAALCSYALGYRFYSKFIAAKLLALDGRRATPAERLDNGRDFVPTSKWVVFGFCPNSRTSTLEGTLMSEPVLCITALLGDTLQPINGEMPTMPSKPTIAVCAESPFSIV